MYGFRNFSQEKQKSELCAETFDKCNELKKHLKENSPEGANYDNFSDCKMKSSNNGEQKFCFEYDATYNGGGKKNKVRKGSLESNTVVELCEKCSKRGIKYRGLKKNEMIALLRKK